MKALWATGLALAIAIPAHSQQNIELQNARLRLAADWLQLLCVVKDRDFESVSRQDLTKALVSWEQDTSDVAKCDLSTSPPNNTPPKPPAVAIDPSALRLNAWQRIARIGQFQTEIQETPDYVYGILQGEPSTTPSMFLPDPDHALVGLGGPLYLNELYVGADTRAGICDAVNLESIYKKYKYDQAMFSNKTSNKQPQLDPCFHVKYIEARRKRDNILRITAAMTLNINFLQVPKYESQIVLTSLQSFGVPEWSKTITGSFNPAMLYRSVAEKKALAGYAKDLDAAEQAIHVPGDKETDDMLTKNKVLKDLCDDPSKGTPKDSKSFNDRCVELITIGQRNQRLVISMLPTVNVVVTSPFDLAKYGTSFVAPPGKAGQSLYDVTLTWNLRNLIPSSATRLDAFNSIKTLEGGSAPGATTTSLSNAAISHPQISLPVSPTPLDTAQKAEYLWKVAVAQRYMELWEIHQQALNEKWWTEFTSIVLNQRQVYTDRNEQEFAEEQ